MDCVCLGVLVFQKLQEFASADKTFGFMPRDPRYISFLRVVICDRVSLASTTDAGLLFVGRGQEHLFYEYFLCSAKLGSVEIWFSFE